MKSKKIFRIITAFILLFLLSNMLFVSFEKIQCHRMLAAIENNDMHKLESILKFASPNSVPGVGIIDVVTENIDRRTPLGTACDVGNFEMVKLLVEKGADVNYIPLNAYTSPLGLAVQSDSVDNLKIVRYLIEKGADIDYSKYKTRQPAYRVMFNRNLPPNGMEILKELLEAGADSENEMLLQVACFMKHEEAIRCLVEEWGYDASDPYYLCSYCFGGGEYSYETFEYFLKKGANPYEKDYHKDKEGKCAIDYLKDKSPEWAEKLISLAAEYGFEK